MGNALDKLTIKGFKSIKSLEDFKLGKLNIMIGGNGAGKSNFVEFFQFMEAMSQGNLASYVMSHGGCDDFLFNGPQTTSRLEIELHFDKYLNYTCSMLPTSDEKFIIENEIYPSHETFGGFETSLLEAKEDKSHPDWVTCEELCQLISGFSVYHFHETGVTAALRRSEIIQDNHRLRFNAANIAPFLLNLRNKHKQTYQQIINTIQLVCPFFDQFVFEPIGDKQKVNLSWHQKGSDYPLQPYHFSDGTIRFICLTAALLQPNPSSTIILDEPELGLHPYAIKILAELIQAAAKQTQLIVSTQSSALIDCFDPQDLIIVNRKGGASCFERLNPEDLFTWLRDYTLGDLWCKNIITGGPMHE